MTLIEIRDSGLLELYVLGDLDPIDVKLVENTIQNHPVLLEDIRDIENSLKFYGKLYGKNLPPEILSNIQERINEKNKSLDNNGGNLNEDGFRFGKAIWPILFFFSVLSSIYFFSKFQQNKEVYEQRLLDCESQKQNREDELIRLRELNSPNNNIVRVDPTDAYPETKIYLHNNEKKDKSYLQIQNLPELAANQSFQLWSLKGDSDPVPLDLFDTSQGSFFEVKHVEATNAYAITIEPKSGSLSPTLERLIGVFPMS